MYYSKMEGRPTMKNFKKHRKINSLSSLPMSNAIEKQKKILDKMKQEL